MKDISKIAKERKTVREIKRRVITIKGLLMTNEEIDSYIFGDETIDTMQNYDVCLRAALIERKISKKEYIDMERILNNIDHIMPSLSKVAKTEFKKVLSNL